MLPALSGHLSHHSELHESSRISYAYLSKIFRTIFIYLLVFLEVVHSFEIFDVVYHINDES